MNNQEEIQNGLFRNGFQHLRFSKDFSILTVKFDKDMIEFVYIIYREIRFSVSKKYYDF